MQSPFLFPVLFFQPVLEVDAQLIQQVVQRIAVVHKVSRFDTSAYNVPCSCLYGVYGARNPTAEAAIHAVNPHAVIIWLQIGHGITSETEDGMQYNVVLPENRKSTNSASLQVLEVLGQAVDAQIRRQVLLRLVHEDRKTRMQHYLTYNKTGWINAFDEYRYQKARAAAPITVFWRSFPASNEKSWFEEPIWKQVTDPTAPNIDLVINQWNPLEMTRLLQKAEQVDIEGRTFSQLLQTLVCDAANAHVLNIVLYDDTHLTDTNYPSFAEEQSLLAPIPGWMYCSGGAKEIEAVARNWLQYQHRLQPYPSIQTVPLPTRTEWRKMMEYVFADTNST